MTRAARRKLMREVNLYLAFYDIVRGIKIETGVQS
jgi:hypothetical protein